MNKGGSANLNMMNQIATDLVVEKAVNDKMAEYVKDQKKLEEGPKQANRFEEEEDHEDGNNLNISNCSASSGEREVLRKYKEKIEAKCQLEGLVTNQRKELTGGYLEKSEKEFFDLIDKKRDRILCHFYHDDFIRCKLLDKYLLSTAHDHPETLFIRINAQFAPFIVTKLKIKVLPAIYYFENGNVKDMIVGFDEFGNDDNFKKNDFLTRLAKYNGINLTTEENFKLKKKPKQQVLGESDDSGSDRE